MFAVQHSHLFVQEFTAEPLKGLDEATVVDDTLILHIEESEACFALISLILLEVGLLPDFLVDGHFHLFQAVDCHPVVHQPISVDQDV